MRTSRVIVLALTVVLALLTGELMWGDEQIVWGD